MSTSIHDAPILFDTDDLASDDPFDTDLARTLVNNALHFADSSGQVLVTYSAVGSGDLRSDPAPATSGRYYHVATWGPFALRVGASGVLYPIRVRLAGATDKAGDTVTFAVTACSWAQRRERINAGGAAVVTATTASITPAWLDGTASSTLLEFDAAQTSAMLQDVSTIRSVGGAGVSVQVALGCVTVWATSDTGVPLLTGCYAAEYVGT